MEKLKAKFLRILIGIATLIGAALTVTAILGNENEVFLKISIALIAPFIGLIISVTIISVLPSNQSN